LEDPEGARRQAQEWQPPDEGDWVGLWLGLLLAFGGVLTAVAIMHALLKLGYWPTWLW
jgi:hypothetical protein